MGVFKNKVSYLIKLQKGVTIRDNFPHFKQCWQRKSNYFAKCNATFQSAIYTGNVKYIQHSNWKSTIHLRIPSVF
jgi:hypothetical protein